MTRIQGFQLIHKITKKLRWVVLIALFVQGCQWLSPSVRTVYIPEGDAVMLRQDIKADIWAWPEPTGDPVAGNVELQEGWT